MSTQRAKIIARRVAASYLLDAYNNPALWSASPYLCVRLIDFAPNDHELQCQVKHALGLGKLTPIIPFGVRQRNPLRIAYLYSFFGRKSLEPLLTRQVLDWAKRVQRAVGKQQLIRQITSLSEWDMDDLIDANQLRLVDPADFL